ncbi:MAG: hypothetical protein WC602_00950 [archaeon]
MGTAKDWHEDEVYGHQPFRKLARIEFLVEGMNGRDDAAWIQYGLLVNDSVIRCHIEFSAGKGEVLYNPLDANAEKILSLVKAPFKAKLLEEREVPYSALLATAFHFE